jgi:hypothetical protein
LAKLFEPFKNLVVRRAGWTVREIPLKQLDFTSVEIQRDRGLIGRIAGLWDCLDDNLSTYTALHPRRA